MRGDVSAHLTGARRLFQLAGGRLETQVKLFFLQLGKLIVELVNAHGAYICGFHGRFHARGRGRSSRIEKPFSHLTIVVRQVEEQGEAA